MPLQEASTDVSLGGLHRLFDMGWCSLLRHLEYLTLYHSIPSFNDPKKVAFSKHYGKKRKYCLPAFSPVPAMFSNLLTTNFILSVTYVVCKCFQFGPVYKFVVY